MHSSAISICCQNLAKNLAEFCTNFENNFRNFLIKNNFKVIDEIIFPDHYEFKQKDFDEFEDKKIIMTEKDALKCNKIKHNNIWVLPLTLSIDTLMVNKILQKVGLN